MRGTLSGIVVSINPDALILEERLLGVVVLETTKSPAPLSGICEKSKPCLVVNGILTSDGVGILIALEIGGTRLPRGLY